MYHYVYLLICKQPIDDRLYYIGVRTSLLPPEKDNYFSSSKIIKKMIKNNIVFEKLILREFNNREDALDYEVKLHIKFNVKENKKYFNLVNQTSKKFDTTNYIFIDGEKIHINDYPNSGKKYHSYKKITLIDNDGKYVQCDTKNKEFFLDNGYKFLTQDTVYIKNEYGEYKPIAKSTYDKTIHKTSNYGKAPVVDINGNRFLIDIDSEDYINGNVFSVHKNKTICVDNNGNTIYCTIDEMKKNGYMGINKGKINGDKNPNAKKINIYNALGELQYETNGNFKEICIKNNLPFNPLARSYRNNGSKIFTDPKTKKYMLENKLEEYMGWFAIKF